MGLQISPQILDVGKVINGFDFDVNTRILSESCVSSVGGIGLDEHNSRFGLSCA